MINLKEIDGRLEEIGNHITTLIAERNQLIGYKQCLKEVDNEKISGDVKKPGNEIRHKADKVKKGQDT